MSVPGQVKQSKSKKDFGRTRQQKQSSAQKKLEEKTLKYGPYVLGGGVGGLGLKAVIGLLAGKTLAKGATKEGLKRAANKAFGKDKVDAAMSAKDAARKKLSKTNSRSSVQPPKKTSSTQSTSKKPTPKKESPKKPTTKKTDAKKDSGMSTGAKVIGGGALATALGAETIRQANKDKRIDKQSGDSRSAPRTDLGDKEPARFRTQRLRGLQETVGQDPLGPSAGSKKKEDKKKEGMGGKATVSPNQKSRQATLPKEEGIGTKIARALGDKRSEEEMIRTRKMNEEDEKEMGMNKGGAVKKKYGMREGGFTKRGGMYKKGY